MITLTHSIITGIVQGLSEFLPISSSAHIVFATTTYNNGVFETMEHLLHNIAAHNLQNRKIVLIQNGSWAPTCGQGMKSVLESLKGTEILDESICLKSTLKEEQLSELDCVADKFFLTSI